MPHVLTAFAREVQTGTILVMSAMYVLVLRVKRCANKRCAQKKPSNKKDMPDTLVLCEQANNKVKISENLRPVRIFFF